MGLSTDKDDNPVETDAAIRETVHGKSPVTRDIRSPQTITIGIGNDESGDGQEQRDAAVSITLGEKSDMTVNSKSGIVLHYDKPVSLTSKEAITQQVEGSGKFTVKNAAQSLGAILSDFIQAVSDAGMLGSPTTQTMNPATIAALQVLKTRCEALMEK